MGEGDKKEKKSSEKKAESAPKEKKEKKSKKEKTEKAEKTSDRKEKKSSDKKEHKKEKKSTTATPKGIEQPTGEKRARPEVEAEIAQQYQSKACADDFDIISVIGRGSFGKVMQVKKKDDGQIYAMKVLKKEAVVARKQVDHTKAEKTILTKVHHPFIIGLHYAFQTDDKLYMILDFVNGGELFYHLKQEGSFSEERVKFYAAEIALALGHMHSHSVAYRDLKPENILLDHEGHIRITDFGLSKEVSSANDAQTFCGTPEYLAPEVLKGQGHGVAVDWWSLGTLVYEMMAGLPPFYSENVNSMYQKILTAELRFPSRFSDEACSFLEGVLTREPEKRLGGGPGDIEDIKKHPWFADIDWDKLYQKKVVPPFIPPVENVNDLSQIDPTFTDEPPVETPPDPSIPEETAEQFPGFTFVNENEINNG